jgi:hypothetical protein
LKEVERVSVANFMPGNIIFDIVLVEPANLTVAHISAGLSAPTITGGTGAAASRKGAAAKATGARNQSLIRR